MRNPLAPCIHLRGFSSLRAKRHKGLLSECCGARKTPMLRSPSLAAAKGVFWFTRTAGAACIPRTRAVSTRNSGLSLGHQGGG